MAIPPGSLPYDSRTDRPRNSPGIKLRKPREGDAGYRRNWPRPEADVIDRFFDAFMVASLPRLDLVRWPAGWSLAFDMADVLTMAVTAGGDLDRLLRAWTGAPDPAAAIHIASLRGKVLTNGDRVYFHSPYLEDHQDAAEAIGAGLMQASVTAHRGNVLRRERSSPAADSVRCPDGLTEKRLRLPAGRRPHPRAGDSSKRMANRRAHGDQIAEALRSLDEARRQLEDAHAALVHLIKSEGKLSKQRRESFIAFWRAGGCTEDQWREWRHARQKAKPGPVRRMRGFVLLLTTSMSSHPAGGRGWWGGCLNGLRKIRRNRHADEAIEDEPRTTIHEEGRQRRWYRERKERQLADPDVADQVRRNLGLEPCTTREP